MKNLIVHKVVFIEEAVFDYENCLIIKNYLPDNSDVFWQITSSYDLPIIKLNSAEIKAELEEYIQRHSRRDFVNFFRVRHYDEQLGRWIMLFIKRDKKTENKQCWIVCGICFAEDYNPQHEYRYWFDSRFERKKEEDWVVNLRKKLEIEKQEYEFMEREDV